MQYLRIYESQSGGAVDLHPLHGTEELNNNFEASRIIADYGHCVELLPELKELHFELRKFWMPDVAHPKNPDIRIDGIFIGDIKTPNPKFSIKKSTINQFIYKCAKQKAAVSVINLMGRQYLIKDIKKGIIGALQPNRNKSISQVWLITRNRKLFKVLREMAFDESVYEELGTL